MSSPTQYTPSTITLFIIDSLMGKCHIMWQQCSLDDIKEYNDEIERRREADNSFYLENNQDEYNARWQEYLSAYEEYIIEHGGSDNIETGDAALDDDTEYCSEMEDCLLAPTEEITTTDEEPDDDDVLSMIDFSEEINLNELYN